MIVESKKHLKELDRLRKKRREGQINKKPSLWNHSTDANAINVKNTLEARRRIQKLDDGKNKRLI